jgi:lipopolysaccharide transport system permease protein
MSMLSNTAGLPPLTVIEPSSGWRLLNVAELWRFRELLYFLAWRDVKVRYKQTMLGAAWAVLQPLLMMVVFSLFFGRFAGASQSVPYPLFVFAGLLPWTFFAAAISNAGNSVVGSERLITKVYFPRLAVPLASVGSALVDFGIACGVLGLLMIWFGVMPSWSLLLTPAITILVLITGVGVGTLLAALNVAFRDFKYVIPFLVQLWMFATPTIYLQPDPTTFAGWRQALMLNPMIGLVGAFRSLTLGVPVDWPQLALSATTAVVLFALGCFYFRRVEDGFADVI